MKVKVNKKKSNIKRRKGKKEIVNNMENKKSKIRFSELNDTRIIPNKEDENTSKDENLVQLDSNESKQKQITLIEELLKAYTKDDIDAFQEIYEHNKISASVDYQILKYIYTDYHVDFSIRNEYVSYINPARNTLQSIITSMYSNQVQSSEMSIINNNAVEVKCIEEVDYGNDEEEEEEEEEEETQQQQQQQQQPSQDMECIFEFQP